jgi:MerR family copper efflux transcriptional regulator
VNISEASKRSGVSPKMIRYYERMDLLPKPERTHGGHRVFTDEDVQLLCFLRRARSLGLSVPQMKQLFALWRNQTRSNADVKALIVTHLKTIEQRISELQALRQRLRQLAENCPGDGRPECPILDALSTAGPESRSISPA